MDLLAAACLAFETKRLAANGFEERSATARSCSVWRIPRISLCVAGERNSPIGLI